MIEPDRSVEPFVSVILAVRNESAMIARCLGAILAQDYPPDRMEVLVADGASDDDTRARIAAVPGHERVVILDNPRRIQAAGLNLLIGAARGRIIVRVDGHTVIAPDYVRQCVAALGATGAATVGGPLRPVGTSAMGRAIAAASASPFAVPAAFHHGARSVGETDTVYLGAWPRAVLLAVGGYDERLRVNEDYELNVRIRQAGGHVALSPAIRSAYYGRQTLGALAAQYFRYGQGKTRTLRKHPGSVRPRQIAAPALVAALAVGLVGGALWRPAWLAALALALAYALALALASLLAARRAGWGLLWRLPLVFGSIHLCWGGGFWAGWLAREPLPAAKPASGARLAATATGRAAVIAAMLAGDDAKGSGDECGEEVRHAAAHRD